MPALVWLAGQREPHMFEVVTHARKDPAGELLLYDLASEPEPLHRIARGAWVRATVNGADGEIEVLEPLLP